MLHRNLLELTVILSNLTNNQSVSFYVHISIYFTFCHQQGFTCTTKKENWLWVVKQELASMLVLLVAWYSLFYPLIQYDWCIMQDGNWNPFLWLRKGSTSPFSLVVEQGRFFFKFSVQLLDKNAISLMKREKLVWKKKIKDLLNGLVLLLLK